MWSKDQHREAKKNPFRQQIKGFFLAFKSQECLNAGGDQRACRISILVYIQNSTGQGPGQSDLTAAAAEQRTDHLGTSKLSLHNSDVMMLHRILECVFCSLTAHQALTGARNSDCLEQTSNGISCGERKYLGQVFRAWWMCSDCWTLRMCCGRSISALSEKSHSPIWKKTWRVPYSF